MTIGLLPIRTPLGRSSHRHGLSVLRWAHHRTSDDEPHLMIRIHPHKPEENRTFPPAKARWLAEAILNWANRAEKDTEWRRAQGYAVGPDEETLPPRGYIEDHE